MGVPFDLLSAERESPEIVDYPKASSDSLLWSTTAFDTVPSFLASQLRSVRLLARPHQSYYVYDGNASIIEARTCYMRIDPSELLDRHPSSSPSYSSPVAPSPPVDVLFFCSRWCCQPDCCQINASIWLAAFFILCSLILYAIHFCADDYRRREIMRRLFKNYRPVRRSNALRQKKSSATAPRPRWREAPRISIDPPTPSVSAINEKETSFAFGDNDVIL